MGSLEDGRGILFPARLPTFHREPAPTGIEGLVRWFWIPLWDIAPGRVSRQNILPFPASNLVVDAAGVGLSGPTTGPSFRDLSGKGWAVGALLRPAAILGDRNLWIRVLVGAALLAVGVLGLVLPRTDLMTLAQALVAATAMAAGVAPL